MGPQKKRDGTRGTRWGAGRHNNREGHCKDCTAGADPDSAQGEPHGGQEQLAND
jgi:hypothetical protein